VEVRAGDVVVIPPQSAFNEGSSDDLLVVGSFPRGPAPLSTRAPGRECQLKDKLGQVPTGGEPGHGAGGRLLRHWAEK